jgi:uncharacterized membrane protein
MKKMILVLGLLSSAILLADTPAVPAPPTEWLKPVLDFITQLPVVGPYLTSAVMWIGALAAVLTALTTAFSGIVLGLAKVMNTTGLQHAADALTAFHDKVWPWLAYFSIYNAPPKPKA